MRFETTKGVFLTAATQEDAAILAAQYNMGEIARALPTAPSSKPRRQMSVATAVRIIRDERGQIVAVSRLVAA